MSGLAGLGWAAVFGALVMMLSAPTTGWAQSASTGTVSGNVVDVSGGEVVNATVTLTSIDEGTVLTTKVSQRGEYLFQT